MISTSGWLFICFTLLVIKYCFILPHEDKRLFRMFEARDNVTLAATLGEIDQDSKEYKFVINQINFEIYYIKNNYDFSIIIRNIFRKPEKVKCYFDAIYKLISEYEVLQNSIDVSTKHFFKSLNLRLFVFNLLFIKPFYLVLLVTLKIFELFESLSVIGNNTLKKINVKLAVLKSIDKDFKTHHNDYFKRAI